jgi:hypothetical protein
MGKARKETLIPERTSWSGQGLVPHGEVALRCQLGDQLRMQYFVPLALITFRDKSGTLRTWKTLRHHFGKVYPSL